MNDTTHDNAKPADGRTPPSLNDLARSLQSTTCPACRGVKQRHYSFCRGCYFALPKSLRPALYSRIIGNRYAQAFMAALDVLGIEHFYVPDRAPGSAGGQLSGGQEDLF